MAPVKTCQCCFENGEEHHKYYTSAYCRAYSRQVTWNRKVRRLLTADGVIPVSPAPDYSLKTLEAWAVSQSMTGKPLVPNTWWCATHALLAKEPKSMKGFTFMPKGEVT